MDLGELYHFLFETIPGIGVLIGVGLVLSILASVIMERRTRKRFANQAFAFGDQIRCRTFPRRLGVSCAGR